MGQLQAAPADKGQPAPNLQRRRYRQAGAGLKYPAGRSVNQTLHYQGLGLLSTFRQTPLGQQEVNPFLGYLRRH